MYITKIDLSKVQPDENPFITTVWRLADSVEVLEVYSILSKRNLI